VFTISSIASLTYITTPLIENLLTRCNAKPTVHIKIRSCEDDVPLSAFISIPLSILITVIWILWRYWLLTDAIALCLGVTAMSFLRLPSLKIATIILWIFFFYYIFWVFLSKYIFVDSVMVSVATRLPTLPIVIIIPRVFLQGYSLLGMGDIILPGLYICFLKRFDKFYIPLLNSSATVSSELDIENGDNALIENNKKTKYFRVGLGCYASGMVITLLFLVFLQTAQPALLYLVPSIMIPTMILGWKRKEFKQLWNGIPTATPSIPGNSVLEGEERKDGVVQVEGGESVNVNIDDESKPVEAKFVIEEED